MGDQVAKVIEEKTLEVAAARGDGDYLVRSRGKMTEVFFRSNSGKINSLGQCYGPDHGRNAVIWVDAMVAWHGEM